MQNLITLSSQLSAIKGIYPKFLLKLKKLGIETVGDLLWHFPTRYDDYSRVCKIEELKEGDLVTIRAEIRKISSRRAWKTKMSVLEVLVTDETGGITLVWFNQPFISKALREGMMVNFAGKVFSNKSGLHIANPNFEILKGTTETTHTAGLIPVYPETRGLTSKGFRQLIKPFLEIIKTLDDFIPEEILEDKNLPKINTALKYVHFPRTEEQTKKAKLRFAFEYIFLLQLSNLRLKDQLSKEKSPKLSGDLDELLKLLPFTLTKSQAKSLDEILKDIKKPHPMNRLLQGDVASGKTAVAAIPAVITAKMGFQAVFMAPTEVLARQHYKTLTSMFKELDCGIGLITGNEARVYYSEGLEEKITKPKLIKKISAGEIKIIIGTHALISGTKKSNTKITFSKLGLVIIDEQHRFGVRQRAALAGTKENDLLPHFLSMSATPIPRTLSLAIFGDLDVSTINELPKGRKEIITKVVDPKDRAKAYGFIKQHIKAGRQAFFIYPRIESSEEKQETDDKRKSSWNEVKAVKAEFEKISKEVFPDLKVGMLHGKLKAAEKAEAMKNFKEGKTDILISTSVVEVGVDVQNATIMVIEGAERFGLAQLYQFRGRVGRGEHQSFCLLFTDSHSETTHARLTALTEAKNGFELAEKDLELRGPGQFLGERQTGMPDLAMDSLNNIELIKSARDSSQKLLKEDSELKKHPLLKEKLANIAKDVHLE